MYAVGGRRVDKKKLCWLQFQGLQVQNFEKLKATIEKQLKPENQSKKQNLFIVKESETEQIDSEIEQNKNWIIWTYMVT